MTVLRIETKTASTETAIISISLSDWRRYQWLLSLEFAIIPLMTLLVFVGWWIMPFWLGTIIRDNGLITGPSQLMITAVLIGIVSVAIGVLISMKTCKAIEQKRHRLLKKHGWDGKSLYRVGQEQPQHFPLD